MTDTNAAERAREVLAEHLDRTTCFTTADNQWVERGTAIRAMIEFASQAAQPAEADVVPTRLAIAVERMRKIADSNGMAVLGRAGIVDLNIVLRALAATPTATPPAPNDDLRAALERLVAAGTQVSHKGATTGPQWVKLNAALSSARAALKENRRG